MRLAEVLGQKQLVSLFKRLVQKQRLPQGILLEGKPGAGRRTLARAIAQAHLCTQPREGDACGQCESCALMLESTHPDCLEMPHDSEMADIPVARIREEVAARATESALLAHGRVFVIYGIERLRPDAANALLKVLEEPPAQCVFIMTCQQREAVLPTIRSRSQCYRMNELSSEALRSVLLSKGFDNLQAERLAQIGQGTHRGLSPDEHEGAQAPLAELQAILKGEFDMEMISAICEQMPESVPNQVDMSLSAYRREVCQQWLDQLLVIQRERLRQEADIDCVSSIERIHRLRHDLSINIDPRLVIEGLAVS